MKIFEEVAVTGGIELFAPLGGRKGHLPRINALVLPYVASIKNEATLIAGESVGGKGVEIKPSFSDDGDSDPNPKKGHQYSGNLINFFQAGVLPDEGYVRLPQILAVIPVSKSTWWAGVKAGRFPQPIKLGPRITAWRVSEMVR